MSPDHRRTNGKQSGHLCQPVDTDSTPAAAASHRAARRRMTTEREVVLLFEHDRVVSATGEPHLAANTAGGLPQVEDRHRAAGAQPHAGEHNHDPGHAWPTAGDPTVDALPLLRRRGRTSRPSPSIRPPPRLREQATAPVAVPGRSSNALVKTFLNGHEPRRRRPGPRCDRCRRPLSDYSRQTAPSDQAPFNGAARSATATVANPVRADLTLLRHPAERSDGARRGRPADRRTHRSPDHGGRRRPTFAPAPVTVTHRLELHHWVRVPRCQASNGVHPGFPSKADSNAGGLISSGDRAIDIPRSQVALLLDTNGCARIATSTATNGEIQTSTQARQKTLTPRAQRRLSRCDAPHLTHGPSSITSTRPYVYC